MRAEFGEQVGFLALSLEPDVELVGSAAARLGVTMPVAIVEGEILGPLGVNAVPSTVFVAADGTIVAAASGARTEKFFRARVRELLGAD